MKISFLRSRMISIALRLRIPVLFPVVHPPFNDDARRFIRVLIEHEIIVLSAVEISRPETKVVPFVFGNCFANHLVLV